MDSAVGLQREGPSPGESFSPWPGPRKASPGQAPSPARGTPFDCSVSGSSSEAGGSRRRPRGGQRGPEGSRESGGAGRGCQEPQELSCSAAAKFSENARRGQKTRHDTPPPRCATFRHSSPPLDRLAVAGKRAREGVGTGGGGRRTDKLRDWLSAYRKWAALQ